MLDRRNPYKLDMNQILQSSNITQNLPQFLLSQISYIYIINSLGRTGRKS